MTYNPSSFNYTPQSAGDFGSFTPSTGTGTGSFQPSQQFQDFSKWLAQQGMDMFNLARADKNTQLNVMNQFQQQQADRANAQQQFQNQMLTQAQNDARMNQSQQDMAQASVRNAALFQTPFAQNNVQSASTGIGPILGPIDRGISMGVLKR